MRIYCDGAEGNGKFVYTRGIDCDEKSNVFFNGTEINMQHPHINLSLKDKRDNYQYMLIGKVDK